MKTNMKFFIALALTTGFVVSANAQSAVNGIVNANASVQSIITVTEVQPLEFGTVNNVEGQTKTISLTGVATSNGGAPGQTGVQQGIGQIVRTNDAIITYKLISPTNELLNGASILTIGSYVTAYSFLEGGPQTAGNGSVTTDTQVAGEGDDIFVHIGATVTATAATTLTGTHTAEITLSAEYN